MQGENITNVESNEIKVLVGNDTCTVQSTVSTMINCLAPLRKTPVAENVMVGIALTVLFRFLYIVHNR